MTFKKINVIRLCEMMGQHWRLFFFFKFYLIICKRFVRENIKVNTLLHYLEVAE